MLTKRHSRPRHSAAGLSIVELLVGVAIGMVVAIGAVKLFVETLQSNRKLLVESRVSQELRAAADVIARDLRRAGYWQNSLTGVVWPAAVNPNTTITLASENSASSATYVYDTSTLGGFKVNASGSLQAYIGGAWNDLTDPSAVVIPRDGTGFSISLISQPISLGGNCTPACSLGSPSCPQLNVRTYVLRLKGSSPDGSVTRQIEESIRVRNDQIVNPSCP